MKTPTNVFKKAMLEKQAKIGLWLGLASHYSTEICAGAGFDWLLIDGEHSPNDLRSILQQAQTIAGYSNVHAVARVPAGFGHVGQILIKQYLDLGIQTLLVPMVDTADQAREIVRSMRYPPNGVRGVAGARASRWGQYAEYAKDADAQVCLLIQVETCEGMDNVEAIAAVDGVDGIFIGPADLSASMGHIGNPSHPEVQAAIEVGIARIVKSGIAPGILTTNEQLAQRYLSLGALFVAVGVDHALLGNGARSLASKFKGG